MSYSFVSFESVGGDTSTFSQKIHHHIDSKVWCELATLFIVLTLWQYLVLYTIFSVISSLHIFVSSHWLTKGSTLYRRSKARHFKKCRIISILMLTRMLYDPSIFILWILKRRIPCPSPLAPLSVVYRCLRQTRRFQETLIECFSVTSELVKTPLPVEHDNSR